MRKLLLLLLVLISAGSLDATAQAPDAPVRPEAAAQRLRIFDQVWTDIRDRYYDPAYNGVDWNAVRSRYRPQVEEVGDDAAFLTLLRAMTGTLRDAHTRVLSAQQARDRRARQTTSAGVILFEVEGTPVIFAVRPGGPAAEAGLRPGMRVLAVNDVPIAEALAAARAEVGASSSERAARVLAYLKLLEGAPETSLRLRIEVGDGAPREVALPRRALDMAPAFEARRLPSGALYVRFDRFREPVARRLREALLANRDAPGLVLDLRANSGGDGREGVRAIGPLLDRPTLVARLATRTGRPPSALLGLVRLPLELVAGETGGQLYAGPVIILVNEGTGSTAEVMTASLQEIGRARVIGATSCGCALGVLRYRDLPGGGALAVSEIGLVTGRGRRVEGAGVTPDVAVHLTLSDLRQGRDVALDMAVRELASRR